MLSYLLVLESQHFLVLLSDYLFSDPQFVPGPGQARIRDISFKQNSTLTLKFLVRRQSWGALSAAHSKYL